MKNKYDEIISAIVELADTLGAKVNINVTENGNPIVNIKDNEDQLKTVASKENDPEFIKVPKDFLTEAGLERYLDDETKNKDYVFVPKSELLGSTEQPHTNTCDFNCSNCSVSSDCDKVEEKEDEDDNVVEESDMFGPDEKYIEIAPHIFKDCFDETYMVRESANGSRLTTEVPIVFDYTAEDDLTTPGITDADLALILLYRNRANKDRYNALLSFLKLL